MPQVTIQRAGWDSSQLQSRAVEDRVVPEGCGVGTLLCVFGISSVYQIPWTSKTTRGGSQAPSPPCTGSPASGGTGPFISVYTNDPVVQEDPQATGPKVKAPWAQISSLSLACCGPVRSFHTTQPLSSDV